MLSVILFTLFINTISCQNSCPLTTRDVEGPFYESGGLENQPLAPSDELADPNDMVFVQGQVLNGQNCQPIANALVEVWHAGGKNKAYTFPPAKLWFRGVARTDQVTYLIIMYDGYLMNFLF